MKRIIYAAVALIFCASVFGVADYLNARKHGTLVDYKSDTETGDAIIASPKTETHPTKEPVLSVGTPKEARKAMVPDKKTTGKKLDPARYTEVIPNLTIADKVKDPVFDKLDPATTLLSKTTLETTDTAVKPDNTRKLSLELFSRAPIRYKKKRN